MAYEACDDGNTANGDGCSSKCKVEPGYRCTPCAPTAPRGTSCCDVVTNVEAAMWDRANRQAEEIAALSRSLVNTQTHIDELNRKQGNSGVYAARQYYGASKRNVWEKASYVSDKRG